MYIYMYMYVYIHTKIHDNVTTSYQNTSKYIKIISLETSQRYTVTGLHPPSTLFLQPTEPSTLVTRLPRDSPSPHVTTPSSDVACLPWNAKSSCKQCCSAAPKV